MQNCKQKVISGPEIAQKESVSIVGVDTTQSTRRTEAMTEMERAHRLDAAQHTLPRHQRASSACVRTAHAAIGLTGVCHRFSKQKFSRKLMGSGAAAAAAPRGGRCCSAEGHWPHSSRTRA